MERTGHQQQTCAVPFAAGKVADTVLEAFRRLPKTGKPQAHEHTVLAGTHNDMLVFAMICQSDLWVCFQALWSQHLGWTQRTAKLLPWALAPNVSTPRRGQAR